jgi:hypothetical protein
MTRRLNVVPFDWVEIVLKYFSFLLALALSIAGAHAQQSSRSATSLAVERSIEPMKRITAVPYRLDQDGNLVGRSEAAQQTWHELAAQLNRVVTSANPADVDNQAIGDILDQFQDRLGLAGYSLSPSVAHLGSRAVIEMVDRIKSSSDREIQGKLAEGLISVACRLQGSELSNQTIDAVVDLLDPPTLGVVSNAALTLGKFGPRARAALPALEKVHQAALVEEKTMPIFLGPTLSYLVQLAMDEINGRTDNSCT